MPRIYKRSQRPKVRLHIYIDPMLDAVLYRLNVGPTEFFAAAAGYFLHSADFKKWQAKSTGVKRRRGMAVVESAKVG